MDIDLTRAGSTDRVEIATLTLRDGLQSTGVWKDVLPLVRTALQERRFEQRDGGKGPETPALVRLRTIAKLIKAVGYTGAEVFWGQSFQKYMIAEISPYEGIELLRALFGDDVLLSGLGRGVNAVGFRPYGQDAIDSLVTRFAERGGAPGDKKIKMRIFDALNSPENCAAMVSAAARHNAAAERTNADILARAEASPTGEPKTARALGLANLIHIEAALCYQPEREISKWGPDGAVTAKKKLFTDDYYLAYARKQIQTAEAAGSRLDSLVVKDMAGQLTARRIEQLLDKLRPLGLPVYLHMHCTNYDVAVETMRKAADLGVAGVEVADWPIAGGTSHASVRDILDGKDGVFAEIDRTRLTDLEQAFGALIGDKDTLLAEEGRPDAHRDDLKLTGADRLVLWRLGIPGGAMPAVMDLLQQMCRLKKISLNEAVDRFEAELEALQGEIGWVPLVTPMADIVYTQAILNMQNGRYRIVEDRFAKMILGHYGRYVDHANGEEIPFSPAVVSAVVDYCAGVVNGTKLALGGKAYPAPEVLRERKVLPPEMEAMRQKMLPLLQQAGLDPAGPEADEAIVMKLMEPPASTSLTERILLAPQQDRLLHMLEELHREAGEPRHLFATAEEIGLFAGDGQDQRIDDIVQELLNRAAERSVDDVLDRECRRINGNAEADDAATTRREVVRLLEAALQSRFVENNVLMAKTAKEIPFDPRLALYYSQTTEPDVSFAKAEVRQQMNEKLQQAFRDWLADRNTSEEPEADYNNRMLHAVMAGDDRLRDMLPVAVLSF